jgi:ATP-dependent exoDNAse (exonuclease V) beta subunit
VVVCYNLDSDYRTNLWDIAVVQDVAFDVRYPLANRRIRFWPRPFGGHQTGVPLVTRIENEAVGKEALAVAAREELRLLYVGFTRARDMLVLVTNGQTSPWLDLLQAPWLRPVEGHSAVRHGRLGAAQVPYRTRNIPLPESIARKSAAASYRWFPVAHNPTAKLPALILPSKQSALASAKVARTIHLGTRLPISGKVSENILGDALHAIFAAEFVNPRHPDRLVTIERILQAYGLNENIKTQDTVDVLDRFAAYLDELFQPKSIFVEVPFQTINDHGQRTFGFIDLVLETENGRVIIDHKSFLGGSADWPGRAQSHSGQLAAYAGSSRGPVTASTWIHFAPVGGLVQIAW